MVDLHAIISEAGAEGIHLTTLKEKSNLRKADLDEQIKQLRSQHLIAGPFKSGNSNVFYAKGYEPNAGSVGVKIEGLIRGATKLQSKSQLEEKLKSPFNKFFKDAVRTLVADGRVAELKGGSSVYLLHIDVVRQLFRNINATDEYPVKLSRPEPASSSSFKEQVLHAYHALKAEQGGLSAVSIGKLLSRLSCLREALHSFLLEEARRGNADLHPTTVLDLSPEDREGAVSVPGKVEPAITVTFR
jgi:hypothetical protein